MKSFALMKRVQIESVIKNLLVVLSGLFFFQSVKTSIYGIGPDGISDFLLIVSVLLMTVSFANFAFSYEHSKLEDLSRRILAHVTTFLFLLLTFVSLECVVIATEIAYPSLGVFITVFSWGLFLSIILYDHWDLLRAFH